MIADISMNVVLQILFIYKSSLAGEAIWMQEQHKVPFVVTEHWSGFTKATSSQLKLAQKVLVEQTTLQVSQYFACQLQNMFREKFNVVPNTVEVDFFEKGSEILIILQFLQVPILMKIRIRKCLSKRLVVLINHLM